MKKLLIVAALVAGISLSTFAQEGRGFYLKPTGSYFLKVTPVEFPNVGTLPVSYTHLDVYKRQLFLMAVLLQFV